MNPNSHSNWIKDWGLAIICSLKICEHGIANRLAGQRRNNGGFTNETQNVSLNWLGLFQSSLHCSFMKNYPKELAELQEEYAALKENYAKSQNRIAELEAQQVGAVVNNHQMGVTLTNGKTVFYDADTHAILPSKLDPKVVEFRKTNKANRTYKVVASARWAEVSEVHNPTT